MADHVNKQLRDAVKAILTGLPSFGARVHGYRINPLQVLSDLPALIVSTPDDSGSPTSIHSPAGVERTVAIVISAYVQTSGDLDDAIDALRMEIEPLLGSLLTVSGKQIEIIYENGNTSELGGEKPVAELQLRYRAVLYHAANAPDVLLG